MCEGIMGNASKKLAAKCTLLSRDEQKTLANSFRLASRNSERIREDDLAKLWGPQMDARLAQYLANFLFGAAAERAPSADFQRFAELYVYNVRGTADERLAATCASLGAPADEDAELPYQLLKEYCESVASTYMKMLKSGEDRVALAWIEKGFRSRAVHVQALGEALAADVAGVADQPPHVVGVAALRRGLESALLLRMLCEAVFRRLYGTLAMPPAPPSLLPAPVGLDAMPDYPAFSDLAHIVWINSQLQPSLRDRWRFLFSTHIHGESFSTMMGRIVGEGPTVIIVEDQTGHAFGGFASASWTPGSSFHGTEECFLFAVAPKMRCYQSSGYNDHYQYLNTNQKTMPNGLMMGGQFGYGGLWIDYEFGEGSCAESCTTFRHYRRLSKEKHFRIRSLEVWGVGEKPKPPDDEEEGTGGRSVLDGNTEAKAILELAGRTQHSAGLREEPGL